MARLGAPKSELDTHPTRTIIVGYTHFTSAARDLTPDQRQTQPSHYFIDTARIEAIIGRAVAVQKLPVVVVQKVRPGFYSMQRKCWRDHRSDFLKNCFVIQTAQRALDSSDY